MADKDSLSFSEKLEKLQETVNTIKQELGNLNWQTKTLLTPAEAAQYSHRSISWVYQNMAKGNIKYSKPGGKVTYISKDSLDEYLMSNR